MQISGAFSSEKKMSCKGRQREIMKLPTTITTNVFVLDPVNHKVKVRILPVSPRQEEGPVMRTIR
jgi:hypothetical protein